MPDSFTIPTNLPHGKSSGPLSGTVVLDLTRVLAGPYCTMLLADLGAEIVKIEPPERGDDARHFGPFVQGKSAYFMPLNRGKRSIALDLKAEADRAIFHDLLSVGDVLVENYRGGTMEKLKLGYDVLETRYPQLIYAAVSGFGHSGPYMTRPAYDMVVQAMGGIMSLTGHPGAPPTRVGTSIGDLAAGVFTAYGIVAALFDRQKTGKGMKVDVGMLDCQVALLENALARYFATDTVPGPLGARHPSISPFEAYATADGHIIVAAGNDSLFEKLSASVGKPELAKDARFLTNDLRCRNVDALKVELEGALVGRTTGEWQEILLAQGVPSGPINTVREVVDDPQILARKMIVTADDPTAGKVYMAGNPVKLSAYTDSDERPPAPDLDADRDAILEMIRVRKRA